MEKEDMERKTLDRLLYRIHRLEAAEDAMNLRVKALEKFLSDHDFVTKKTPKTDYAPRNPLLYGPMNCATAEIEAIHDREDAMNAEKWKRISDILPREGQAILAYCTEFGTVGFAPQDGREEVNIELGWWTANGFVSTYGRLEGSVPIYITHWTDLPEEPTN